MEEGLGEHAQLMLVVAREDRQQELDVRVAHAQLSHKTEVGHLHGVAAATEGGVGAAHRTDLERDGQPLLRSHAQQHLLQQLRAGGRP